LKFDVTVLTDSRYCIDRSKDPYVRNVLLEDRLVCEALENAGLRVARKAWDDSSFDFGATRSAIFRTTWDYFDRFGEFLPWLKATSQKTRFFNSMDTLLWNIDKHYLLDMQDKNVPIVPSYFIEIGDKRTLAEHIEISTWDNLILKPAVSGAARHTYRVHAKNASDYEAIFAELVEKESMMLQPFMNNVLSKGEISLVLFDGNYSHAVIKKAKSGDFRVQDDFGGSVEDYQANSDEIAFAKNALAACKEMPLYARVDLIWDNSNELALSELELIEPELWFRNCKSAAADLAKALKARL
jgi:glutathione synthase/RimK-type ligase-like ATP-grasp enzyme